MTSIKELDREEAGLRKDSQSRSAYELLVSAVDKGDPSLLSVIDAKVLFDITFWGF